MPDNKIIIFSDGASKGNPGPGAFGSIIILPENKVIELGDFEKHTTNNRMELSAAISALAKIQKRKEDIIIYTDSKYLIHGMNSWTLIWQKNNWQTKAKTEVLNRDLWEKLCKLTENKSIKWNYVGGHMGIIGNERCDEIASTLASGEKIKLYQGSLEKYGLNILDLVQTEVRKKEKSNKNVPAYSYLSLVDDILKKDKNWAECEKRVKGKKGAKYQKAISESHEKEILRKWNQDE